MFTCAFLLVLSLFSNAAVTRFVQQKRHLIAFEKSYDLQMQLQNERERINFIESKQKYKKSDKQKEDSENQANLAVDRRLGHSIEQQNHFHFIKSLNLYQLLEGGSENQSQEDLFLRLFERLYSKQDFYTKTLGKDLLVTLRKLATASKNQTNRKVKIKCVEDLGSLDLQEPVLQEKLYKVLKGCQVDGEDGGYPSLCPFLITHRNKKTKINLYLAPYDLLCIFFNEETAAYVTENRPNWKCTHGKTEDEHGKQIKQDIIQFYGKDFSKYEQMVTFRIRSK